MRTLNELSSEEKNFPLDYEHKINQYAQGPRYGGSGGFSTPKISVDVTVYIFIIQCYRKLDRYSMFIFTLVQCLPCTILGGP